MVIARIIAALALPVTNQSLADMALQCDQERRAALRAGDRRRARELDEETAALAALLK